MEETKNNKKGKLLYTLLGVTLLLALVGGAYAFFSASVSRNNIGGQTQNINNDSLTLTVKKVVFAGVAAPSNDLVPAYFGLDGNDELVVSDPSHLTQTQVANMLTNKCVSDGFTGCHVYQIKIQANQNITHANLLLNLSVSNLTGASNVVDKSQWGYVVFSGTETENSSDNTKTDSLTVTSLNASGHGGQAAIGNGVTNLDIHSNGSLTTNTPVTYYLLVYVNDTGVSQNTSTSGTGDDNYAVGTYSGSLELQALGGKVRTDFGPQVQTAAEYITSLYTGAEKSTATVNGITYNLASSQNLMNDRHASMDVDADAGDIRYYGAKPKNYVWLGDSYTTYNGYYDYDECVEDFDEEYCTEYSYTYKKLWRIIGVFDGRLKLIQAEPLQIQIFDGEIYGNILDINLSWDISSEDANDGAGINQWGPSTYENGDPYEGADLMRLLNPGFEDEAVNNSLYWNKGIGTIYSEYNDETTVDASFARTGLSTTERSMIDTVTWYLGAASTSALYVDQMYNAERQNSILGKICTIEYDELNCSDNVTRTATWNGKVGLIYPSDFGYAVDLSIQDSFNIKCSHYLSDYYVDICSNNWMKKNYRPQHTITPYANNYLANEIFYLTSESSVVFHSPASNDENFVFPVIYLNTNVMIDTDGNDGSGAHPYRLFLS